MVIRDWGHSQLYHEVYYGHCTCFLTFVPISFERRWRRTIYNISSKFFPQINSTSSNTFNRHTLCNPLPVPQQIWAGCGHLKESYWWLTKFERLTTIGCKKATTSSHLLPMGVVTSLCTYTLFSVFALECDISMHLLPWTLLHLIFQFVYHATSSGSVPYENWLITKF